MKRSILFLMATAIMAATFVACEPKEKPVEDTRNWSEDGGLRAADNLLFGDTIGNGDDEFRHPVALLAFALHAHVAA